MNTPDNGLGIGQFSPSSYKWIQSYGGPLVFNPVGNNVGGGNTNPADLLVVGGSVSPAYCNGTSWVNGSDRNSKESFAAINARAVMEKVSSLPITEWKYKVEADGTRHLGPMAQDFHTAFGLNGGDDKHIATVDTGGDSRVEPEVGGAIEKEGRALDYTRTTDFRTQTTRGETLRK